MSAGLQERMPGECKVAGMGKRGGGGWEEQGPQRGAAAKFCAGKPVLGVRGCLVGGARCVRGRWSSLVRATHLHAAKTVWGRRGEQDARRRKTTRPNCGEEMDTCGPPAGQATTGVLLRTPPPPVVKRA